MLHFIYMTVKDLENILAMLPSNYDVNIVIIGDDSIELPVVDVRSGVNTFQLIVNA